MTLMIRRYKFTHRCSRYLHIMLSGHLVSSVFRKGTLAPLANSFALGPALHTSPIAGTASDERMELSYAESGWADKSPAGSKGSSTIWRVVAFLSDVFLCRCDFLCT